MGEDYVAAAEGGVATGLAVEDSRACDGAAGGEAAYVVEFRRCDGAGYFPFTGELAKLGFHFFVDVEFGEVLGAGVADGGKVGVGA